MSTASKKERDFVVNELDQVIARNLERLKGKDVTIEKLAEIMNTSVSYAWNLLNGKRRWNTSYIKLVCDYFGWPVSALFEGATSKDIHTVTDDEQRRISTAYYSLSDEDKKIVDRFMFPDQYQFSPSDTPLTDLPKASSSKGQTKEKR